LELSQDPAADELKCQCIEVVPPPKVVQRAPREEFFWRHARPRGSEGFDAAGSFLEEPIVEISRRDTYDCCHVQEDALTPK
jgi:hypothetical protein